MGQVYNFMESKVSNFLKTTIMKKNGLILASLLVLFPMTVSSQENLPVRMYSKAKMYVAPKDASATGDAAVTMYVEGSAKFGNNSETEAGSAVIVQQGVTKLIGDFVDAFTTKAMKAGGKEADMLFASGSFDGAGKPIGTIWFAGKDNVQRIYRDPSVYANGALMYNYINFPNLRVNQTLTAGLNLIEKGYVSVDTTAVISVGNLLVGAGNQGGFAVEASYDSLDKMRMRSGYALVKDINDGRPETSEGLNRVNYVMWKDAADNSVTSTNNTTAKQLIPFASPFKELAIDYTFYQVVFEPNGVDLSSGKGPILDPRFKMAPGKGYFLAQEVSDFWYNRVDSAWNTLPENRFQGKYEFSRNLLNYYASTSKPNYSQFEGVTGANAVAEYFNTGDVTINLTRGFNFVGNPYMAPISLKSLINKDNPAQDSFNADFAYYGDANSATQTPVIASRSSAIVDGRRDVLHARYYVPHTGYVYHKAAASIWEQNMYYYGVKYYAAQAQGGTTGLGYSEDTYSVAPMGVFGLSAGADMTITLKRPTEDVFVDNSILFSPKSMNSLSKPNELLIQAVDNNTGFEDRLCLVFTDKGIAEEPARMNVRKTVSDDFENKDGFELPAGLIYTKSINDKKPMLTNFVSEDVEQMAMYIVPPTAGSARNVTLKPYRMETLDKISQVWVEDRLDGTIQELTEEGLDYSIPVASIDAKSDLDYRFILHFKDPKASVIDPVNPDDNNGLLVYYNASTLYIKNLIEKDTNSIVEIYDMQGRLISKFKISNEDVLNTEKLYSRSLAHGAYIVKISGKRNYTAKFLSI